jgi:hypothetical protein
MVSNKKVTSLPNIVKVEMDQLYKELDTVQLFLDDCYDVVRRQDDIIKFNDMKNRVTSSMLYIEYKNWCLMQNIKNVVSNKQFKNILEGKGFEQHKSNQMYWFGFIRKQQEITGSTWINS